MESLQIAQILADLSDLQNTDPIAATALLDANHSLNSEHLRRKSAAGTLPDPPKFDRLGRRIVGPIRPSPTISRTNSALSGTSIASVGTVGEGSVLASPTDTDEEMTRAKTLLDLFEKRGHFKQMGDIGLLKSKERVDAVVASYARKDLELKESRARAKHLSPRN